MQPLFSSAFRTNFGAESVDAHPYHCTLANNGLSPRNPETHGVNPIQEDHYESQGDEAVATENVTHSSHGGQTMKDAVNKHVESPSNPIS